MVLSFVTIKQCAAVFAGLLSVASAASVGSTVLIFARDEASAYSAYSGLQGYGIPYQVVTVPSAGVSELPQLNTTGTDGNYGSIVVLGEVSYDYNGVFQSALTTAQWQQLYDYQTTFGARMVRIDVYPGPNFGSTALGGTSEDQPVSISNSSAFPTANLKLNAGVSTAGLYHYPATISDPATTWEIASFAAGGGFEKSTAAVINQFGKREQMAFFLPFATQWSQTSNFLQHSWIHWATRGFYAGFRRTYFSTQIDDVFLATEIYYPSGQEFRLRVADLEIHKSWMPSINAKMPAGSNYIVELGHNGNGVIEAAVTSEQNSNNKQCSPAEAIEYDEQIDTPLEFQKPLGSGTDIWPATPTDYTWSLACAQKDPLLVWIATPANRDAFMHISHTFTHMGLNNATYADTDKEIFFNQKFFNQTGISSATHFSFNGIIPPAITGLHNGDAIRAWMDNGIIHVVGDNTRPVLMNQENSFWPLYSNVANNGYDGLLIMPRWATTIYYNCDSAECTTKEWTDTSAGNGQFSTLLSDARTVNSRNLLGLHWDAFMFHQANLRVSDMPNTEVNGVSGQYSLLQIWTETIVNEMTRLTDWPLITLKHDDLAIAFRDRQIRDQCAPKLTWTYNNDLTQITGGTLTATNSAACNNVKLPVTFPGPVTSANGFQTEQIGADPLTVWVVSGGSPQSFQLQTPITV